MSLLSDHTYGYQVSWYNLLTSAITGFSGFPYARRHYELSNIKNNWMMHRMIALIEFMPIIGGITFVIEKIANDFFSSNSIPWRKVSIGPEKAIEKMMKNQKKAMAEHWKLCLENPNPYLSSTFFSETLIKQTESKKLGLSHHSASAQGLRPTMEDAHFYVEWENGVLTGVFDGHGGSEVSSCACNLFQKKFPEVLKKANGNVHQAFEIVIHQIHENIVKNPDWNSIGSTAVVCYIDKETHQVFTATLGDSEANIYRKISNKTHSIPLSCLRNWSTTKDLKRLCDFHEDTKVLEFIKTVDNIKSIRSNLEHGLNVSRALGDVARTGKPAQPLLIHKPKITLYKAKPGDKLIITCDGAKDFLSEQKIISIIDNRLKMKNKSESLANQLVNAALKNMSEEDNDNVTVIVVEVS